MISEAIEDFWDPLFVPTLLFNSGDTVPLAAARRCSNLVKEISRVVM